MEKKEEFKAFVRNNPILIKYVKNNEMTWQKFYEIYDIYGDNYNAWEYYLKEDDKPSDSGNVDIFGFLKTIDMDKVQEGVQSLQRVVGVIGEMANGNDDTKDNAYKPRPLYKHFDD